MENLRISSNIRLTEIIKEEIRKLVHRHEEADWTRQIGKGTMPLYSQHKEEIIGKKKKSMITLLSPFLCAEPEVILFS